MRTRIGRFKSPKTRTVDHNKPFVSNMYQVSFSEPQDSQHTELYTTKPPLHRKLQIRFLIIPPNSR